MSVRQWSQLVRAGAGLLVAASAVLGGCSSCDTSGKCPEEPCGPGQVCKDNDCVDQERCEGACKEGQICSDGECVWDAGQCSEAGVSCDPNGPTKVGYVCVPWTGDRGDAKCAQVCSRDSSCPSGSACVVLESVQDEECSSNSDCPDDKSCTRGTCRFAACRPSECGGFLVGDEECQEKYGDAPRRFPDGAKCYPIQNGANFCLPAGTRKKGDSCVSVRRAVQAGRYENTCARGLACVEETCVKACTKDQHCSNGESCIGVQSSTVREGIGQCADACTPFSDGACDGDETCKPVGDGEGRCIDAGEKSAYASCVPGDGECEKGTVCVVYQSQDPRTGTDSIARCHPLCDVSAGSRSADGSLSDEAQAKRDATCPQPAPEPARVRFVSAESAPGPLDLYQSGRMNPLAQGLKAGTATRKSGQSAYFDLDAGKYQFSVRPKGAPRTDAPLARVTARLGPGDTRVFIAATPDPKGSADLKFVSVSAPDRMSFSSGETGVRAVHTLADTGALDIVAVPAGSSVGTAGNRTEVAAGLSPDSAGETVSVSKGEYDFYVFPAGADRSDPKNAVVTHTQVPVRKRSTLVLHGTVALGDRWATSPAYRIDATSKPRYRPSRPATRCIEHESGAYGYCQQRCTGGAADYGRGICRGDKMGCVPVQRSDRQRREHLCAPVGDGEVGDPCRVSAEYGQCKEGNYCLEYGNTRKGYSSGDPRGLCRSLCATGEVSSSALQCGSGRSCEQLSYRRDIGVGRCGIPCTPNERYTDADACPAGLKSCNPVASLERTLSGQGNDPPAVRQEQPFCSASGDVPPGQSCRARNCKPRAECLFPRTQQSSTVESLLSPYVGTSGERPQCELHCDPFDGDDAAVSCGSGETCLFNYPWSAEVGHCAEIESRRDPGESCSSPGLSCGEDSICVPRRGGTRCMRFCDYEGPNVDGELERSTCPSGYECFPFVRDIGYCRQ